MNLLDHAALRGQFGRGGGVWARHGRLRRVFDHLAAVSIERRNLLLNLVAHFGIPDRKMRIISIDFLDPTRF